MPPQPLELVVLGDVSCPWCYISKRRLSTAMSICAQVDFEVHWVPFSWDPNAPKDGVSKWDYFTGVLGAQKLSELFPVASKAYEEEGLTYTLDGRTGCNMDAHRLLAWAAETHGRRRAWELLERIYNAYHCQGVYVGSSPDGHVNLLAAAERAGLPRAEAAAVLAEPQAYVDRVRADMAAHKGVKAIPRVEIAGKVCMSGCKTVEQYVTAIRAALRDLGDEEEAAGARRPRQREEAVVRLAPQPPAAPCPSWPNSGALTPQPQRYGSPMAQPQQPQPQPQPHPPQQPPPPQPRPLVAAGSQAQPYLVQGPGQSGPGQQSPQRASPSMSSAPTRSSAANPLQQLLQAHAAAAAATSKFQRSSSGPHMLHHHTLSGGAGGAGGGGGGGGGRAHQASGLSTAGRQFGSGRHDDYSAHAGTVGLQVRVTATPGGDTGCPSASAPVTWMDDVEPMSPSQGPPSGGAASGGGGGEGGRAQPQPQLQSPAGIFTKCSDGGGGSCSAAVSPRVRLTRGSSDREGPRSAGAASYSSGRGACGAMDDGVPSPVGSAAEQQPPPRRYRRPPVKGKSLLQLVRSDLHAGGAAGSGSGGGGGGGVLLGGDRAERVDSAVQVLQLLHSNLLGGGGGGGGAGGGRDLSPSSRSLLAGRLGVGVGGASNRVRGGGVGGGATDREGALIATALLRKTFRERAVASADGTTDVFQPQGMLGVSVPGDDGGGVAGGPGRLGRSAATAVGAAGLAGPGAAGGVQQHDRVVAVTAPGGPTAAGGGPARKQSPAGRSLTGVGSTSIHHQHQLHHSPQRSQYDRSSSVGVGGAHSASVSAGAAAGLPGGAVRSTGSTDGGGGVSSSCAGGGGGSSSSAPTQPTRLSYNGGMAIPGMVGGGAISSGQVGGAVPGGRSLMSPDPQVLRVSLSGRLPTTQDVGGAGRAAADVSNVLPHFASGPVTQAAAAAPGGGVSVSGGGATASQPIRLLLSAANAPAGDCGGGNSSSSNGRDAHSLPLTLAAALPSVPSVPQLSPGGGTGAPRHSEFASPLHAVHSATPAGLVLSEAITTSLPPASPRAAAASAASAAATGTAGGSPGPGSAATTPTGALQSHASNKVVPFTSSVSVRPPPLAAAASQLLLSAHSSGQAATSPQSLPPPQPSYQPSSQPQSPQPPSQPPQLQSAGGKPSGRIVPLTSTRAAGGSVPQVAVAADHVAGPPSTGSAAGRGGTGGVSAAGGGVTVGSRAASGSSVGEGNEVSSSRRKLRSFLPPLLARLFG